MLAVLAEFERDILRYRVKAGIARRAKKAASRPISQCYEVYPSSQSVSEKRIEQK
jgi:DNA invertase Pin-like site-specific DNA recombinase